MVGLFQARGCKVLAIYCNPDHTHVLVEMSTQLSISDLVKEVKSYTSKWINKNSLTEATFQWQSGYAAFSYSRRSVPYVINYIRNQAIHHARKNLRTEYEEMIKENADEYDLRYMFDE